MNGQIHRFPYNYKRTVNIKYHLLMLNQGKKVIENYF